MQALTNRNVSDFDIQGLERIVGARAIDRIRQLADKVHREFRRGSLGIRVWHINSSAIGGGVADILNCLVPFSRSLGMPTEWFVMGGDEKFFQITKAFHNVLQGSFQEQITAEMFIHYYSITRANAVQMEQLCKKEHLSPPDIVVFHDPQPAGLIPYFRSEFPESHLIWRGHIQFDLRSSEPSHPGLKAWNILLGFVNQCDAAIFHLPDQVPPGITAPVSFILPSINPLAFINRDLSSPVATQFVDSTLSKYRLEELHDRSIPLVIQNARFDPWKDPQGVIQAFREARSALPKKDKLPHLILIGPRAEDDPQAREILVELGQVVNGDEAVHVLPLDSQFNYLTAHQAESLNKMGLEAKQLLSENLMELEINAFQTRADIIIAKSTREGFGLAVTGAGYHGKPRIVSQVGGLAAQVTDKTGKLYAFMAGCSSEFSRETSITMTRDGILKLLSSPALRRSMGRKAKRHVIQNFLPHRHLEDYLQLFLKLQRGRFSKSQATAFPTTSVTERPVDP